MVGLRSRRGALKRHVRGGGRKVVAHALAAAREAAAVGTRLTELDEVAHDVLRQAAPAPRSCTTTRRSRPPRSPR